MADSLTRFTHDSQLPQLSLMGPYSGAREHDEALEGMVQVD